MGSVDTETLAERSDEHTRVCLTNHLEPAMDVLDLDHDSRLHPIVIFDFCESDHVYERREYV